MGLAETQKLLARLYTDVRLRERFVADPHDIAREHGLDCDEASRLARLSASGVNFFADSLRSKRLHQVCTLLPHTRHALGARMSQLFRRHADSYTPAGTKQHLDDALAFARHLKKVTRTDEALEQWIVELSSYEATRLQVANTSSSLCVVRGFSYDVRELCRKAEHAYEETPSVRRPALAVWFRLTPRSRIRHAFLSFSRLTKGARLTARAALCRPGRAGTRQGRP